MLKTGVLQVSGRGSNVDFILDDDAPFDQVSQGLREYLVDNRRLWASGTISINAGRRILSREQMSQIQQVIELESGLTVSRFWYSPGDLGPTTGAAPAVQQSAGSAHQEESHSRPIAKDTTPVKSRRARDTAAGSLKGLPTEALFIKETFRSGEFISHDGDVVVLADVNPGAEISAQGDIVVFGCLRGLAHAGAGGDVKAAVIALELKTPRIQIGPYTGMAPTPSSKPKSTRTGPQIAYVRRRNIYVSTFTGRFTRYSRGILYDG